MITKDNFDFFWGGIYSPDYPIWMKLDGKIYYSFLHFLMEQSALLFGDKKFAKEIMKTQTHQLTQINRKIKNFDYEIWEKHSLSIATKGNYAKFSQDGVLAKQLLKTRNQTLVFVNKNKFWGIGMEHSNPNLFDPLMWEGGNMLGKVLMEVREKIKLEYNEIY